MSCISEGLEQLLSNHLLIKQLSPLCARKSLSQTSESRGQDDIMIKESIIMKVKTKATLNTQGIVY